MLLVGNKSDCVADLTAAVGCRFDPCLFELNFGVRPRVCSALRAVSMPRQKG